ncbi:site-2 protease family protein [Chitinophaga vietnamensis]|uniref:site-2 protease family protein n=1 Tax=Chitinophaga vietnamensis TaxID=2593957 RepID=UPI0011786CFE|nr:site-2 protease family protein [Chitinophaga vietnamensis]
MHSGQQITGNNILGYHYEALHISPNEFILSYNQKYYKIGESIYQILKAGSVAHNMDEMHRMINDVLPISRPDLEEIIDAKILPVFRAAENPVADRSSGFWVKRQILTADQITALTTPLRWLFGKIFYPLFFFICFVNVWMYRQSPADTSGAFLPDNEVATWFISYAALFVIIFLHELGHAAAAVKSGIRARNIGLGFYTVLPVMYTDLTDTWKLGKYDKVKINMGGIFMQLIVNLLLMALIKIRPQDAVTAMSWKIYVVNNFIIIMNLVPFMKFDGYWVVSDLTGIPNMVKESNRLLIDAVTRKGPFPEEDQLTLHYAQKIFLYIYTVLRVLFIGSVIFSAFAFIYYSVCKTILLIKYLPYLELNFTVVVELLKRIATIVIIFLFTRKYRKMFFRFILKKAK